MTAERRLLELLVCPICKSGLELWRDSEGRARELVCQADRLAFPIRDGLPVMLEDQARALAEGEAAPKVGA
jgi:uncharacterized protein